MGTNIAIITGASRGFGAALALDLASDGWRVVVTARHEPALLDVVRQAPAGALIPVAGDVADPDHRNAVVARAAELGGLDLLVNNASTLGVSPLPRLGDYPLGSLEDVFRTNVVAALGLVQDALPLLRRSPGGGAVVNITSDAGLEAYEGWGGYGASKAALEQLSHVLSVEEPGLHVWWFDPGDMRTQMHQDAFPGEDISDRPEPSTVVPALRQLLAERPPSGRVRASDLLASAASAAGAAAIEVGVGR